jgi:hypothetical protein
VRGPECVSAAALPARARRRRSASLQLRRLEPFEPSRRPCYCFFDGCCWTDCAGAIRSAAVFNASWITTDCSVTTRCVVFTSPDATRIASDRIFGSDAIRCASAWTDAASSSSDFCNSGDGLNFSESSTVRGLAEPDDFPAGCCDRAAEAATAAKRTRRSAIRLIIFRRRSLSRTPNHRTTHTPYSRKGFPSTRMQANRGEESTCQDMCWS